MPPYPSSGPSVGPACASRARPAGGAADKSSPRKLLAPQNSVDRRYRMSWNGKRIGWHRLAIRPRENGLDMQVLTEIEMKVKIGPITAFQFRHHAEEHWRDGGLQHLQTRTEEDGEISIVRGRHTAAGLELDGPLGSCLGPHGLLTSNTLWSKAIVGETQIIDAQRGGVVPLSVADHSRERLSGSHAAEAARYRFTTPTWHGDLWYDHNDDWIKAVLTRNGQTLTLDRDT